MGKTLLKVLLVSAALPVVFAVSETRAEIVDHHGLRVDSEDTSSGCLSCHDGTIGSSVSSCTVDCTADGSHSIEKEYPPAGEESKYATVESILAAGIKLSGNRVACISCHDLANQSTSHLRISNDSSGLCAACHIR